MPRQFANRSKLNSFLDLMIKAGFTDIEEHVYGMFCNRLIINLRLLVIKDDKLKYSIRSVAPCYILIFVSYSPYLPSWSGYAYYLRLVCYESLAP